MTAITNYELLDQTLNLVPRCWYKGEGGWSRRMWGDLRHNTGRGDKIIGTDRR